MWDLPGPGIKPVSHGLQSEFLTTGPPGKPLKNLEVSLTLKIATLLAYTVPEFP